MRTAVVLLTLCACGPSSGDTTDAANAIDAAPLAPTTQLDVLFVIDNSGSSEEVKENVIAAFPTFTARLESRFAGALPDVHVGVTSGSVGVGGHAISGCEGDGDDGILQNAPRNAGCEPPAGLWIEDAPDGGGRARNYTGTLDATFACIANLGIDGCGYQQHLTAIERALDGRHAEHAGFVRPGAILAVVIVTDDDDCSAADTALYDPDPTAGVGPLSSFRCAKYGWLCNGAELPDAEATYTDCAPRTDSFLVDPADTVSFLQGLKQDPRMVVMAGVFADRSPVSVTVNAMGEAHHQNICPLSPHSTNIRDRAAVDAIGGVWVDSCDADLGPGMARIADHIADRMVAPSR